MMSLTREEWIELWNTIKHIKKTIDEYDDGVYILEELQESFENIETKIQSVIGQMEK